MGRKITMFRITSIILLLALQLNAQSLLLLEDEFELNSVPGLQLLVLPNRDLAGGWTSDIKVVTDYSQGGKQYGSELVTNGGFDTDSDWQNTGTNWIIEDGVAKKVTTANVSLYQEILEVGKYYRLELDNIVDGEVVFLYNGGARSLGSTAGRKFIEFQALQTQLYISFLGESGGQIDNVSVKEITNGSHGLYKNSMELNQTAGNKFLTFDGTDDYIDFGTDISLTDNFSISVLFKTTDNTFALVDKYDFGANQRAFQLIVSASGILEFYESPNGVNAYLRKIDGLVPYNTGDVNFLTLTKSGTTLKAYINGVEKVVTFTDATTVSTLHASTAPLLSGARLNSGTPGYFGVMDKGLLAINTGVLTLAQHQQIYYSSEIQSIKAGM